MTLDTTVRAQLLVPMRGLTHDPSVSSSLKVLRTFIVLGQLDCEIEKTEKQGMRSHLHLSSQNRLDHSLHLERFLHRGQVMRLATRHPLHPL